MSSVYQMIGAFVISRIKGVIDVGIEVGELYATLSVKTDEFNSDIDRAKSKLSELKKEEDDLRKAQKNIQLAIENCTKKLKDQAGVLDFVKQANGLNSKQVEYAKNEYKAIEKELKRYNEALLQNKKRQQEAQDEIKQVNKELNNQTKAFTKTAKQATSAADQIKSGFTLIKGLIVGYAGKTLYDALIGTNADYERSMTSFDVLLGSAEKAETLMKQIQDFSASTPLKNEDVQQATQLLLSYGVSADEVMEKMRQLGDISQGNAEKLQRVSLAYGQMLAKGKVTGEELRQMTEAGVPLVEELSKVLNISTSELSGMIEKGQVGIPELNKALESMTSQGGKFFGMLEKQSQTMTGMLSTLSDNANIFARKVGEESFEYLKGELNDLMATINEMSESGALDDLAADIGEDIANAVVFIVDFIKWIYEMKAVLLSAAGAVVTYKVAFAALTTAVGAFNTVKELFNIITGKAVVVKNLETGATVTLTAAEAAHITTTNANIVAQTKLNAVMGANPYLAVASVILAVVSALVIFCKTAEETKTKAEELSEEFDRLKQSHDDAVKSIENTAEATITEMEAAKALIPELETLCSKTDRSEEENARLHDIVNRLNQAFPDLKLAIDEETGALNRQISTVYAAADAFIALARAKALSNIATENEEQIYRLQKSYKEQTQTFNELDSAYTKTKAEIADRSSKAKALGDLPFEVSQIEYDRKIAAQTALATDKEIDRLKKENQDLANESSKLSAENQKIINNLGLGGSSRGGGGAGGSTSSGRSYSGGSSSARNAEREAQEAEREAEQQRQEAVKAYVEDNAERERIDKRTADRALEREIISQEQYLAIIADKANRYRAYAEEILELDYMTEEEKLKYHKEYIEKAEDADDEYLAYFKKINKEEYEEKKANSLEWIKQQEKERNYDEAIAGYDRMKNTLREYYEAGVIGAKEYEKALKELNDQQLETQKSQYYWDSEDAKDYISRSDYYGTWGDDNKVEAIKRQLADLEAARATLGEVEYSKELDYWMQQLYECEKEKIDKLFDEESKRLKERYQQEIDNAKEIGDKRIAEAERVAEAETEKIKKRTEKELAALDELEKARQEEKEDKDDNLELERLQNKLAYEMDEDNRKALEREIEKKQEEIADKEIGRTIEAQRDAIKEREQLDLDRINRTLEYEKVSAQQMVEHFTKLYTDKMSDANIAYEIYRKVDFTQYEKLGESLGAAAGEGFSKVFSGIINNFMEQMKTMGWGANAVTVRGGGGATNTYVNNVTQTITSPRLTPSAISQATKKALKSIELAGRL